MPDYYFIQGFISIMRIYVQSNRDDLNLLNQNSCDLTKKSSSTTDFFLKKREPIESEPRKGAVLQHL
jgi:hypothetical protein